MPGFQMPHDHPPNWAALDEFTAGFIEAMFFTDTGSAGDDGLGHVTFDDLAPETLDRIKAECAAFMSDHADAVPSDRETEAGRDFWYTRCGHGAGFWDGDWPEPAATALTAAAEAFGSLDLYRGDDGKLYLA